MLIASSHDDQHARFYRKALAQLAANRQGGYTFRCAMEGYEVACDSQSYNPK